MRTLKSHGSRRSVNRDGTVYVTLDQWISVAAKNLETYFDTGSERKGRTE